MKSRFKYIKHTFPDNRCGLFVGKVLDWNNIPSLYENGRLKSSYKIASDIVWTHLAQAMGFCEYIYENCGIVLDYLTEHKILKEEPLVHFANNVENEIIRRFPTQFLMNIFSQKK
jgi:hypothetical protein